MKDKLQVAHRVAAGVVAAMAVLTALSASVMPAWVTASAAIVAVCAHAVEAGIEGSREDQ